MKVSWDLFIFKSHRYCKKLGYFWTTFVQARQYILMIEKIRFNLHSTLISDMLLLYCVLGSVLNALQSESPNTPCPLHPQGSISPQQPHPVHSLRVFFWLQVQRGLWSSANKGILSQNGCWSNSEAIAPSGVALPCQHTLPENSVLQTPFPLLPTPDLLQVLPADFSVLRTLLTTPSSCLWPSSAGLSHQAVRLCRALPWFSGPAWAKP